MKLKKDIVGRIYKSVRYGDLIVREYNGCLDVLVEFIGTGFKTKTRLDTIEIGCIKDPLYKSVLGVGFIGVGEYKVSTKGVHSKAYLAWNSMMTRCYSDRYQKKQPTYIGCSVCPEWHSFQVFAKWFYDNYIEGFHLDKDMKTEDNKVYSPEGCSFVSQEANTIKAHAKVHLMVSPSGEHVTIYNMREFCRGTDLDQSAMSSVALGKRKQHKGWTRQASA